MESALVPYASSALSNLLGQQATSAVAPLATKAVTDAASAGLGKLLGSQATKIAVQRSIDPLSALQSAYDDVVGFKKGQGLNYESLNNKVFDYSPKYASNRNAIASILGEEDTAGLENNLSGMLKMAIPGEQYDVARQQAANWLNSDASNSAVELSRNFIKPGTKIFRANNSPTGISWTLDRQTAQNAIQDNLPFVKSNRAAGLPDVLEYTVQPSDKIIAPQLTEFMNENPLAQGEVLFDFSSVNEPQISDSAKAYLPVIREDKTLNAMGQSRQVGDSVRRIGSAAVSDIDPNTLPAGWKELEKYLDTSKDRLSNAIGKPSSKITKSDLAQYLTEVGYDATGTKSDMAKNALMAVDDAALDELYEAGGGTAANFLQSRLPFRNNPRLTDATNYYIGNKGRTGRLDAEYSDRLGIGRSNTPMSDRLVNPYGGAGGDYSEGAFGTDPTWATGESGVSTAAHERLHAWQDINPYEWDERVVDAIDELRDELKNFYHDEKAIKSYWGSSKTGYYMDNKEQEARMLQSYLDNEGFTKTYRVGSDKGTEWGNEIKPAFDRFFEKLRKLSKKGIALPSLALLFGGATVAAGADANRES